MWSDSDSNSDSDSILASSSSSRQSVSAGNEPESRNRTALDPIHKSQGSTPQLNNQLNIEVDNFSNTTVKVQTIAPPIPTPTCNTDKVDSGDEQRTVQRISGENVPSESNRPDWQEDKQVQAFSSRKGLENHVNKLKLKRVMLRDLEDQCDLENGYVGGWVIANQAHPYSQGHNVDVYIRDDSVTDMKKDAKYLVVTIDGKIVEEMPTLLSEDFELYLYKPRVEDEDIEYSQDLPKRLVVEGPEPRVWIVHKHAKRKGFFQRKTCKSKWFRKQKKIIARQKVEEKKQRDNLTEAIANDTTDPTDHAADLSVNVAETER